MKQIDYAKLYLRDHKLSVLPLNYKSKTPKVKWNKFRNKFMNPQAAKRFFGKPKKSNIGIVTGQISQIIVLDIDKKNNGLETIKRLKIPDTVTVKTGGGGFHYYFRYPDGFDEINNFQDEEALPGIDLRADGGYVVAPLSYHPNGERYEFVAGKKFGEIDIAQAPSWLIDHIQSKQKPKKTKLEYNSSNKFYEDKNRYSDTVNIFSQINDMVSIVDIWNEFGDGQSLNKNNKIICPFHNDSDPSLSFNIEENYFHCFGCGVGGGPIEMVKLTRNVEALEAAKKISNIYGIEVDSFENIDEIDLKNILEKRQETEKILTKLVKDAQKKLNDAHIKILSEQYGFKKETINELGFGFIADLYLSDFKNIDNTLLYELNIFNGENKKLNENIKGSVIFPIIEKGSIKDIGYISLDSESSGFLNQKTIFIPTEVIENDYSK